jgi:hypothetical protein
MECLHNCKESDSATRGMPTSGRFQNTSTKYPKVFGRAIRRAPQRETLIPVVKS